MTSHLTKRHPVPPPPGLTVDVFIPTYNEPVDLVRKTLLAAKHMDYPHETWLLDDGNRQEMAYLAKRLNVRYIARPANTHAKAGNLNNALKQATGDFIAIFDADHAPQKHFLTNTLGFFTNPRVAFVQTPQDFFNLDSYQHRWQKNNKTIWAEQSLFFKVIQRGKDYWNASFFCGSCAVVRRSALETVGGFPTETITEDLHASIKFHKAGFRSVYFSESLAYGIAPATVAPFLHQRIRWGQGAMQVLRRENIFFTRKLTIAQKLNYLASILTYFDGWQKGLFYVAPVIVLATGILPIETSWQAFLIHFLPYYLLSLWMFEEIGRGHGGILYIEQYNFARFAAFAWATLGFFADKLHFNVTPKVRDNGSSSMRLFWPQYVILILNAGAIPLALLISSQSAHYLPLPALLFNIFWAAVNLTLAIAIVLYTRKTNTFLREEYRFPIPLPVRLRESNHSAMATIDNISAAGCRIYGLLPGPAEKGGIIAGEISLPSGPLAFQAIVTSEDRVSSGSDIYVKAIGCRFIWNDQRSQDKLELFLYGTDLQWRLLEIVEKNRTPIQWASPRRSDQNLNEQWATFSYRSGEDEALALGLISMFTDQQLPRKIITFASLPADSQLVANIITRTSFFDLQLTIGKGMVLENTAGTMFFYPIDHCLTLPSHHSDMEIEQKAILRSQPALLCILIFIAMSTPLNSRAEPGPTTQILSGLEVTPDASYLYAGMITPLPGSALGNGFIGRLWFDWSTYRYKKNNIIYDARGPGAETALGYQKAGRDYFWAAYGGATYRHTNLSPHDPESKVQGDKLGAKVQLEGEKTIHHFWKLSGITSYIFAHDSDWSRIRFARVLGSGHHLGVEAITQGDDDYRLHQFGVFMAGIKVSDEIKGGIKTGVRKIEGLSADPYMGVEFEYRF
ncbi:MAG: glycosyltransferase [Desulfurivibrionaceae bacterium]|nr:glycosyltransferase [Desulfurivibrionaceae bacterium]